MELVANMRPRGVSRHLAFCALALGFAAITPIGTKAAPLDKNACAKLAQDMQNMKALDVDKLMEKGPAWAMSHLSPADLSLVKDYIELDEQMKFRCSAPGSLVHLKHLEDDDDESGPKPAAETAENEGEKPQEPVERADAAASSNPKQTASKPAKKPKPTVQPSSGDAR